MGKETEDMDGELKKILFDLCAIPSPSGHEEKRAEYILDKLKEWGIADAYIDAAYNVVWPYRAQEKGNLLITAHTDTVFPDTQPFSVRVEGDRAYCPGIGDDTANAAVLMMHMKRFAKEKPVTSQGIVFSLNSGEEGLGNLKGIRQLMQDFEGRIAEHVSLDGGPDALCTRAVGSRRYRVCLEAEGGHSYGNFGSRNAIEKLAKLIVRLYEVQVPQKEGSRTTYNVGTVSGGTTVNSIAQRAEMLYEYRSNDTDCMDRMEEIFRGILEDAKKDCLSLTCECVGERPCGKCVDGKGMENLIARAEKAAGSALARSSGSTDCNIPLSMGIPAVCWGACRGKGAHTYGEYILLPSLDEGYEIVRRFLDGYTV